MKAKVITPATPVITLARAKLQAKLDAPERDEEVTDAIETARAWAQEFLQRAVGEQTLEITVRDWHGCLELPYEPTSIVSVTVDGVAVPVDDYVVEDRRLASSVAGVVVIRFVAGYTALNLPGPVKSAMLLMIADLIKNPQGQTSAQLYENATMLNLLWPYRDELGV